MSLTVRWSHTASASLTKINPIDRKFIRKLMRRLAASKEVAATHPHVRCVSEGVDTFEIDVGDWTIGYAVEHGDLVVGEIRRFGSSREI